jgi:archaellum component FlaC
MGVEEEVEELKHRIEALEQLVRLILSYPRYQRSR